MTSPAQTALHDRDSASLAFLPPLLRWSNWSGSPTIRSGHRLRASLAPPKPTARGGRARSPSWLSARRAPHGPAFERVRHLLRRTHRRDVDAFEAQHLGRFGLADRRLERPRRAGRVRQCHRVENAVPARPGRRPRPVDRCRVPAPAGRRDRARCRTTGVAGGDGTAGRGRACTRAVVECRVGIVGFGDVHLRGPAEVCANASRSSYFSLGPRVSTWSNVAATGPAGCTGQRAVGCQQADHADVIARDEPPGWSTRSRWGRASTMA